MAQVLDCIQVARAIKQSVEQQVARLAEQGVTPLLCTVRVGNNGSDIAYQNSIVKQFSKLGIGVKCVQLPASITQEAFEAELESIIKVQRPHGILMFRPFPKHLNESRLRNLVPPHMDVDGMGDLSLASLLIGGKGYAPCTAQACIELLDYYSIELSGKTVTVIGRSNVIGKPVALLALGRNATVTICHSKTQNLSEIASQADILICATGVAKMVGADFTNPNQIVLDVGVSALPDGSIVGDVDFEAVAARAAMITPVPRGIGSITTAILAKNVVDAAKQI